VEPGRLNVQTPWKFSDEIVKEYCNSVLKHSDDGDYLASLHLLKVEVYPTLRLPSGSTIQEYANNGFISLEPTTNEKCVITMHRFAFRFLAQRMIAGKIPALMDKNPFDFEHTAALTMAMRETAAYFVKSLIPDWRCTFRHILPGRTGSRVLDIEIIPEFVEVHNETRKMEEVVMSDLGTVGCSDGVQRTLSDGVFLCARNNKGFDIRRTYRTASGALLLVLVQVKYSFPETKYQVLPAKELDELEVYAAKQNDPSTVLVMITNKRVARAAMNSVVIDKEKGISEFLNYLDLFPNAK